MEKLSAFMREYTTQAAEGGSITDCYRTLGIAKNTDKKLFVELVTEAYPIFFDGKEHSYIELGGIIGSQHSALMLMVFGAKLGVWQLLTPELMGMPQEMWSAMEGCGLITIAKLPQEEKAHQ